MWINEKKEQRHTTLIVCSTRSQAERLSALLQPYGIQIKLSSGIPDLSPGKGRVYACLGHVSAGFVWPDEALAIISEDEIFGRKYHRKRLPASKIHTEQLIFGELKRGDLVVHSDHGIGQYEGLIKLVVDGATNDFLLITYRDADKLYLPVVRMNMIQKYLGVEGVAPVLDKMGGKSWDRVKKQVKQSVEKIAGELLKLYASRKVAPGISFAGIDSYFRDFEGSFSYEETPDQLQAIDDVLQDMQSPAPMDRLVCGDVGYGKTEVALRAAFLAVNNSKQVAVLVPTTVLAEQHFETFSSRFRRYPVRVACLSRFRSAKEQKGIIEELKIRHRGYRDRHPSPASKRCRLQGSRADRPGRRTALRGQAQGKAEKIPAQCGCAGPYGHPDPKDPSHVHDGGPGYQHHLHPAGASPADRHLYFGI